MSNFSVSRFRMIEAEDISETSYSEDAPPKITQTVFFMIKGSFPRRKSLRKHFFECSKRIFKRIKEQYTSSFTLLPYKICEYTKRSAHTRRRSGDIGLVYHIFRVFSSAVRVFGAGYKRKAAHGAANTEPWTAKR